MGPEVTGQFRLLPIIPHYPDIMSFREWIMNYFANGMTKSYNGMMTLPKWLLYVVTGAIGSLLIGLLHRNPKTPVAPKSTQPKPQIVITEPTNDSLAAAASPKAGTTKKATVKAKKSGKK